MSKETRDSFIFYRSFYEAISSLPEQNKLEIFNAICDYSLNFNAPKLEGISATIFTLIKPNLDANNKRFENGKKPKNKQNRSKTEASYKQNGSKSEANKDVNVNKDKEKGEIGFVFFEEKYQIEAEVLADRISYGNSHQRGNGGLSITALKEHCKEMKIEYVE